ncbi:glucose-6-phosphatase catalytic subunit 1-like isoform X1 [Hypomesus transpacificus]|uniref:glucose-6-phosphatase catalytic subunit 1-like isoform X1 n=1 Tax=Hypomesus transpacificus TaxID=137520 RepID=UPI001F0787AA|nr:glucose-6-phosphatase catalytic subunit 1-like isoform X1 [Hypomesus transpacificus]
MDVVHGYGISATQYLQVHYKDTQDWFLLVSMAADLRNTFFVFFPVWFHLWEPVGVKLVWVAVVGDWLNMIFKWILFGERPYWWIQETGYYGNSTVPYIEQFPMTCETGPGSPSGHAMGAAGVYYAMISSLLAILLRNYGTHIKSWCVRGPLWMVFWCVQVCVCVSRVFIAAHFPHQVIAGVFIGIIVAQAFNHIQWIYGASLRHYIYTTVLLLSVALGLYLLLRGAGVDLLWTLDKAQNWCLNPEWVHMDTTPFASLFRNTGTLFGLGLGLHLPSCAETKRTEGGATYKLGCLSATLVLLHLLDYFRPPAHSVLFYLLSFCKSATVPLATVGIVPYCVAAVLGQNKKKQL